MAPRDVSHDAAQVREVHATDPREQVMLDLVVEAANVPGEQPILVGEVRCRAQLVGNPGVVHRAVRRRYWEGRTLDDVCERKHGAKDQASGEVHGQVPDQNLPPRDSEDEEGNEEGPGIVDGLEAEHRDHDSLAVHVVPVRTEVVMGKILIVLEKRPIQRGQAVERERVELLEAMIPARVAARRLAQQAGADEVPIDAGDVGIGVVDDVVPHRPHVAACTAEIEGVGKDTVERRARGVGTVRCIVRDAKAESRHADPDQNRHAEHGQRREPPCKDEGVCSEGDGEHHHSAEHHHRIRFVGAATVVKVGVHPVLQLGGQRFFANPTESDPRGLLRAAGAGKSGSTCLCHGSSNWSAFGE